MRKLLDFWKPLGCIFEGVVDADAVRPGMFGSLPVVFCDVSPSIHGKKAWERRAAFVKHDSAATTRLAVSELRTHGWRDLAYVGSITPTYWSDERSVSFRNETADLGSGSHMFLFDPARPFRDAVDFQMRLRRWIEALPKPCGVLAANDFMGEQVLVACRNLDIGIPDQIALVGIDNEEMRCEHLNPTLASVEPDFRKAGRLAAELLAALAEGRAKPGTYRMFGPARAVRRQSMAVTQMPSRAVSEAMETIRLNACGGLKASAVLAAIGGSRSSAERLFRRVTGCSVLEKINERRFEEVLHLLSKPDVKIDSIPAACGYRSSSFLRRHFKERTGLSMQEWRAAHVG